MVAFNLNYVAEVLNGGAERFEAPSELPFEGGTLRPWAPAVDIPALTHHLNSKEMNSFMSDRIPYPYTQADAEKWILFCQSCPAGDQWAISLEGLPGAVGGIGVEPNSDVKRFTLTLGYWLARPHWGHGIMSKVLPAFLAFIWKAHPEIQRIEAHVYDYNDRSQSVLEKVGFQVEGRLRRAAFKQAQFCDTLVYGLLRPPRS